MSRLRLRRTAAVFFGRTFGGLMPTRLQKYVLRSFFIVLFLCLFASVTLFLVFDLFDRMNVFIHEGVPLTLLLSYVMYKIPLIVQLMLPVALLVSTIMSVGRLSQLSEITAMRACGISLMTVARPLIWVGVCASILSFIAGETVIPSATQRVDEIYHLDIKKKAEKGRYSRANFWYRKKNWFYNIGLYDSRTSTLKGVTAIQVDKDFRLKRRIDAREANWGGSPQIGWTMYDVIETVVNNGGDFDSTAFPRAPLVIEEEPSDFYNMERNTEAMSYHDLRDYVAKLRAEGVPVTNYAVDLAAKLSFPLINAIVILIAFPFGLVSARAGNMTMSFVAAVSIGFGYYIVHALSLSFGNAELIPVIASAWTANILFVSLGGYLLSGMEER